MFGWTGYVLRVNLTEGTVDKKPLNMQDAKQYIGGRGLGTKLFMNKADPEIDPLSPQNRLIFMTGPLTGTVAPGTGRYDAVTKVPLTGAVGACTGVGNFGPELKFAGYDGIILEGKAKGPAYLYINDDNVELRDASHLWGKTISSATEELIKETSEEARVACIGPAGEKLVLFASMSNDKKRAAGQPGLGAVMGSKNLKAVVVKGSRSVKAAKGREFLTACIRARRNENPGAGAADNAGSPEYEAGALFRAGCGVNDQDAVCDAVFLCNELGMDPIAAGAVLACAMELYAKGYVTAWEIGMDLPYGNEDALLRLLQMTGRREGFGDKLAQGSQRMAERFRHPELSVSVKKQDIPVCDGLASREAGLAYATSNRGSPDIPGCGMSPITLGIPVKTGQSTAGDEITALIALQNFAAIVDSSGAGPFPENAAALPEIAEMLRTCTGIGYTDEEFLKIGERIWNLERMFNLRAGLSGKDDTLPAGFFCGLAAENAEIGRTSELDKMLGEYYLARGWDQNGIPTKAKKRELLLIRS